MDNYNKIQNCKWDYEKVTVACPHCKKQNIFSRQDDLHTNSTVLDLDVNCQYCHTTFRIGGDNIQPAFMKIYYDCYDLYNKKEYRKSIMDLCTAYEKLFRFILDLYLTIYPLAEVTETPLLYFRVQKNLELNKMLEKKIKKLAFQKMLYLTLKLFADIDTISNITIQDSKTFISNIDINQNQNQKDILLSVKMLKNHKLRNILIVLLCLNNKNKSINILRNKVAHSTAYCPSKKEVETELLIARKIFNTLYVHLHLWTLDVNKFDFIIKNKPSI